MANPLPPDPYLALGVPKNADPATIKSTYRKLALKCHPDKVKVEDEALKKQKADEFHKIQSAYEIIGDEEKRAIYDAEVKLEQLRKERQRDRERNGGSGPSVQVKTAHYDVRTQAPAGASASFGARGPSRYEVPKSSSSRTHDDYYDRARSKYDTYDAYPKSSSRNTRSEREKDTRSSKTTSDRTRSDEKKNRDKDERRERSGKYGPFVHMEDESSSGDDKMRFEGGYKRRNEEEDARRQAAEARRKADENRRSYENEPRRHRSSDDDDLRKHKINGHVHDAINYMGRAKADAERPSPGRTSSSRDVRPEYYVRKSDRPEAVRRSSARRDRPSSSGQDSLRDKIRDRLPEIVDWGDREERREERRVPSMPHSKSSPADIHVPSSRTTPQRSYTTESVSREKRRESTSPTPVFRRAETSPIVPTPSSSRRKEAATSRPSGLRHSESANAQDSGYSSSSPPLPSYPNAAQSSTSKKYYYPTPGGGVSLRPEDVGVANGHRTIFREPGTTGPTSPTPLSRPPMGANRPQETKASVNIPPPPPLGRSATMVSPSRGREEDRGRPRKQLYGEIPSRENRQQTSYSPDSISYGKRYGPEDIRWAPRGRDDAPRERDYAKPPMQRSTTYAY